MLLVSEKEIDTLAMYGRDEFRFEKLPDSGIAFAFFASDFWFSSAFCRKPGGLSIVYRRFKPQVVLGMGGFTSTAPVLAGRMRGVPTFIHESNAIPGKANRITARFVRAVMLGFKEARLFSESSKPRSPAPRSGPSCNRLDRQSRAAKTWDCARTL